MIQRQGSASQAGHTPAAIRVLAVHPVDRGNLRAYVDVAIGSLTVYGCRIIQQAGQRAWVSPPQRTWQGEDGKPRYAPVVELAGSLKARVEQAILTTWQEGDRARAR